MTTADFEFQWGLLVARAWDDPAFKTRLLADPAGVLEEHGIRTPAGRRIEVIDHGTAGDAADGAFRLVIPAAPVAEDLSDEELHGTATAAPVAQCVVCERCYRCERCHRCGENCYRCERC